MIRVQDDSWYFNGKSREVFCINEDKRTRKHSLCLKMRSHVNSNIGLNLITRRVINYWNHLTDVAVSCKSSITFKVKLDEFMTVRGENYIYCSSIDA